MPAACHPLAVGVSSSESRGSEAFVACEPQRAKAPNASLPPPGLTRNRSVGSVGLAPVFREQPPVRAVEVPLERAPLVNRGNRIISWQEEAGIAPVAVNGTGRSP